VAGVVFFWTFVVEEDEATFDLAVVMKCADKVAGLPICEDKECLTVCLDHFKSHVVLHRQSREQS
jgi:hypothetical protein